MANYLTVAEYRASPTAVDSLNLVADGSVAAQDAALLQKIAQASGWIDNQCNQPLVASTFTELIRTTIQADGSVSLHPRRAHINQLLAVSVGTNGSDLVAVSSLAAAFVDQQNWVVPFAPAQLGWPFSLGGSRYGKCLVELQAISGWPNTTLTAGTSAAATSFSVLDGSGFSPAVGSECTDQTITIYDGANTETVTVTSVTGTTIHCSALVFAHAAGVAISGLPAEIKGVAIDVTSAYLRVRSSEAMVMTNTMTPQQGMNSGWDAPRSAALANAQLILSSYGRVR